MEAKPLEIRLFGEFALWGRNGALPSPKAKKARLLVAHLVLNEGYDLHRDALAGHLWPDLDPEPARFNLRQLLATIRREAPDLSPYLVAADRRTLSFQPDGVHVDVSEFKRIVKSKPSEAISLYMGPLLGGLDDDWLIAPRAELEELFLHTLEALADRSPAREAASLLRRAVDTDPYRETLQQKLLSRLTECGDSAGVKAAYRRFQDILHRELNAEPSPETTEIYRRSSSEARAVSVPPRHRLPVPATEVLGREEEIEELCRLLTTTRLITVLGPGGSGKTRLSIAVGAQELELKTRGVFFIDFSSETEAIRVAQTVGHALGLREPAGVSWTQAIVETLGSTDHLLIFDNCEHVAEACSETARELLNRCDGTRILATSRIPLAIQGEQRFNMPPLKLPDSLMAPVDIDRFSALALFEARAKLVSPRFAVTDSNVAQVTSICREIDAMPLAIEMAAARLAALSLDEVARRLDDKMAFLRSVSRDTVPRHQTLGAVIDWSYELLADAGRTLLTRLSVFAGGWSLNAAEEVCGFGSLETTAVLTALEALVDASLVQRAEDRYHLLETIRQFSLQKLQNSSEEEEVRNRHLRYYQSICAEVERQVRDEGPDRTAVRFKPELDNLRAALDWSLKSDQAEVGFGLIADASIIFSIVQLDGEAVSWLRRLLAVDVPDKASPPRLAALVRASAFYQSQYADVERSTARENTIQACEELIDLSRSVGDRQSLADAHTNLGSVRLWWDRSLAIQSLQKSLEINLSLPHGGRAQRPLRLIGQWSYDGGAYAEAQSYFERAVDQAKRVGDTTELLFSLQAESHLLREHCRYDEALEKLWEIQKVVDQRGDARAAAFNDLRFAELYLDRWEFNSMVPPLTRARAFFLESQGRLHSMLVDGMSRYVDAHEGRIREAVEGVSAMVARLVIDAHGNPSACWHGACLEMECLAYCLASVGRVAEGARVFGAAQSLRKRDWAFLSPSVRARWSHLSEAAGFQEEESAIESGRGIAPDSAVRSAQEMEGVVLEIVQSEK